MNKVELAIKEVLIKQDFELRQRVIQDMVEYWDRERVSGSFPEFIRSKFVLFWLAKVLRN